MSKYKVIALSVGGQGRKKVYDSGDIVDQSNFKTPIEQLVSSGFLKKLTEEEAKLYADKTELPGSTTPELIHAPKEIPNFMLDVAKKLHIEVAENETFESIGAKIEEAGQEIVSFVDEIVEKRANLETEITGLSERKAALETEISDLEAKKLALSTGDGSGSEEEETEVDKANLNPAPEGKPLEQYNRNELVAELSKLQVAFELSENKKSLLDKLKLAKANPPSAGTVQ